MHSHGRFMHFQISQFTQSTLRSSLQLRFFNKNITVMFAELEKYKTQHDQSIKVTEVKINLPHGEWISGKLWGDLSTKPIVCLHGWLNNAGSFDRLIPLLPRELSYLAIDLPGHGRSSWLPDGAPYHTFDYTLHIFKLMKEYKWETISLLGHSMGAGVALAFAGLFPEKVDLMVMIDYNKNLHSTIDEEIRAVRDNVANFITADERNKLKTEPPCYTVEELISRVSEGSYGNISRTSAPYLLERNIARSEKCPNKFFFSLDGRLKSCILTPHAKQMSIYAASILKCPFLFLSSPSSEMFKKIPYFDEFIDVCERYNPKFVYQIVESDSHFFHIDEPEKISTDLGRFLRENKRIWHKL